MHPVATPPPRSVATSNVLFLLEPATILVLPPCVEAMQPLDQVIAENSTLSEAACHLQNALLLDSTVSKPLPISIASVPLALAMMLAKSAPTLAVHAVKVRKASNVIC